VRIPDFNRKKRQKPVPWQTVVALLVMFLLIPAVIIVISDLFISLLYG
jgi:cytosine/uracil/thiamine/allantoin permease